MLSYSSKNILPYDGEVYYYSHFFGKDLTQELINQINCEDIHTMNIMAENSLRFNSYFHTMELLTPRKAPLYNG